MFSGLSSAFALASARPYLKLALVGASLALLAFAGGAASDWGCC